MTKLVSVCAFHLLCVISVCFLWTE